MCLLQEEGDLLCLTGGSDTEGQHCDEGRGERTERDNHGEVCTPVYVCLRHVHYNTTTEYDAVLA